jgi:ketopantoate reductase
LILLQNGLNIEKPFLRPHPNVCILSGISMIGSAETMPGTIVSIYPCFLFSLYWSER